MADKPDDVTIPAGSTISIAQLLEESSGLADHLIKATNDFRKSGNPFTSIHVLAAVHILRKFVYQTHMNGPNDGADIEEMVVAFLEHMGPMPIARETPKEEQH